MRVILNVICLLVFGLTLTVSAQQGEVSKPPSEKPEAGTGFEETADKAVEPPEVVDLRKKAEAATNRVLEFQKKFERMPAELLEVKEKLAALPARIVDLTAAVNAPETEDNTLAARADQAQANYQAVKAELDALEVEAQVRQRRLDEIPELLAKSRRDLSGATERLKRTTLTDEEREVALLTESWLDQTINSLEGERKYYREANELLTSKRDLVSRESKALGELATTAQISADQSRVEMAKKAAKEAADKAMEKNLLPKLAAIARQNAEIAKERTGENGLAAKIAAANHELKDVREKLERIDRTHAESVQQVELIESANLPLGEETGSLLRAEKRRLPRVEEIQAKVRDGVKRLTYVRLQKELWRKGRQQQMEKIEDVIAGFEEKGKPEAAKEARSLMDKQNDLFTSLLGDYLSYTQALSDTLSTRRDMIKRIEENTSFIEQRVLWIRSSPILHQSDFSNYQAAFATIFSASRWLDHGRALLQDVRENFLLWGLFVGLLGYLLRYRKKLIGLLSEAGDLAAKQNCRAYLPTLKAILYSVLIALPFPLLIGFLFWRSSEVALMGTWAESVSRALAATFFPAAALSAARSVSRPRGLAHCHLGLSGKKAVMLFKGLTRALILIIPLVFFREALYQFDFRAGSRICFIGSMVVIAIFAFKVLRPSVGLMSGSKTGLWPACAYPVYLGILAIVISSAVATYLGYFYTVTELAWRIRLSIWTILAIILCASIVMRLLIVSRRRVAFAQRVAAIRAAQAEREKTAAGEGNPDAPNLAEIEAEMVDITKVKEQTQSLISMTALIIAVVALWGVWVEVAPSLKVFDEIQLWSTGPAEASSRGDQGVSVLGVSTGDASSSEASEVGLEKIVPKLDDKPFVSLADLVLAIVTLFLTYFAASNIPGLLEITVLRRLKLKPGGSYTVTTVVRYVIVVVGIITAFAYVDITWGKVQWIAAAITLGVGFGLQEVFANFVAGLILLFERPIRLGDFVTVGGVNGTVTQIRMRATTIRDRGNKELLVPNKEFITGQLVNWTLTDVVIRVEVPVGIAYGSDTGLARELLLEVAKESKAALKDPEPSVVFSAFGASSLDFELRVFTRGADDLIRVGSDLHFAVDKIFREHEIEIAFPQQDLHIRSMPEALAEQVKPGEEKPS